MAQLSLCRRVVSVSEVPTNWSVSPRRTIWSFAAIVWCGIHRVVTDIMLNHDNCPSMVIWGIKDKKPAWYAVRSALRHRTLTESGILTLRQTDRRDGDVYNLAGQKVSSDYRGIVIIDGRKVLNK